MISFSEYNEFLKRAIAEVPAELEAVCAVVAENAAAEAKGMIGHKQTFWPDPGDLRPSTIEAKQKLGFSGPDYQPLFRTGEMRESIQWISTALGGVIGSNDMKMVYHEFGTSKMQPRPILGHALLKTMPLLEFLCGEAAEKLLNPTVR